MEISNGESKVRKIIFNEISFVIAVVGCVSGVIFWVANPQRTLEMQFVKLQSLVESNQTVVTALQNIKDNDLHELQLKMNQIEDRQIKILEAIARLEAVYTKQ